MGLRFLQMSPGAKEAVTDFLSQRESLFFGRGLSHRGERSSPLHEGDTRAVGATCGSPTHEGDTRR